MRKMTGFSFLNRRGLDLGSIFAAGNKPSPSIGIVSLSCVIISYEEIVNNSIGLPSNE